VIQNNCRYADLLSEFFDKRRFKQVRLVDLQFQEDEQKIKTLGLRNLVDTPIDEVENTASGCHKRNEWF